MSRDRHDHEMHPRCPPLGGEVPFRHCRQVNAGLPCHRVVICWADRLDIGAYLRECYSVEEIERMSKPSESRLQVMFDTLARVRDKAGGGSS